MHYESLNFLRRFLTFLTGAACFPSAAGAPGAPPAGTLAWAGVGFGGGAAGACLVLVAHLLEHVSGQNKHRFSILRHGHRSSAAGAISGSDCTVIDYTLNLERCFNVLCLIKCALRSSVPISSVCVLRSDSCQCV